MKPLFLLENCKDPDYKSNSSPPVLVITYSFFPQNII